MSSRLPPGRSRPVVGMLTNDLLGLYADQWLGAVDGAREHGCDLICFCGRALEARGHLKSANAIYDLVGPQSVDGLVVWSSTLGIVVGSERLEAFCRRFAPLPIVSVEQRAQRLGGRFTVDSSPRTLDHGPGGTTEHPATVGRHPPIRYDSGTVIRPGSR